MFVKLVAFEVTTMAKIKGVRSGVKLADSTASQAQDAKKGIGKTRKGSKKGAKAKAAKKQAAVDKAENWLGKKTIHVSKLLNKKSTRLNVKKAWN